MKKEDSQTNQRLTSEVVWIFFGIITVSFIFWRSALLLDEAALMLEMATRKFSLSALITG